MRTFDVVTHNSLKIKVEADAYQKLDGWVTFFRSNESGSRIAFEIREFNVSYIQETEPAVSDRELNNEWNEAVEFVKMEVLRTDVRDFDGISREGIDRFFEELMK
jgi:hypothetical protein